MIEIWQFKKSIRNRNRLFKSELKKRYFDSKDETEMTLFEKTEVTTLLVKRYTDMVKCYTERAITPEELDDLLKEIHND